jgi:S-DNA-T family DNA segregation ATPase FtsK/SpoIIIE
MLAEGAKAGVRVVLITQGAEANTIGGTERSNIATRITFRVDNADSVRLLHPGATVDQCAAVMAMPAGYGLVERPEASAISRFRLDFVAYEDYLASIRQVRAPRAA